METVTLLFYYEDWLKAVYWRAKTSLELSVRIYSCNGDGFGVERRALPGSEAAASW